LLPGIYAIIILDASYAIGERRIQGVDRDKQIYDLLEKIYVELQETKNELRDTKEELKSEIRDNRLAIVKLETKIENEITDKIRGLYDAREVTNDKLDIIEEKMDKVQFDINNLTMKTAQSDNRIIELKRDIKSAK
jgi:chromosome segregation ATPase